VDQSTSNQDRNDRRSILRTIVEHISPAKMLGFCDICLRVAAADWPYNYCCDYIFINNNDISLVLANKLARECAGLVYWKAEFLQKKTIDIIRFVKWIDSNRFE